MSEATAADYALTYRNAVDIARSEVAHPFEAVSIPGKDVPEIINVIEKINAGDLENILSVPVQLIPLQKLRTLCRQPV